MTLKNVPIPHEGKGTEEWHDLSALTMIDRARRSFGPDNCRWATSEVERADNEAFYRSLGSTPVH